jgi:hypothetical protein
LFFSFLESLSVCLAKERRWADALHFGRKACSASEADAKLLCIDKKRISATCIDARLSSSCLNVAIILRDGNASPESLAESEAVFERIIATGKQVFAEAHQASVSVPSAAARTACRLQLTDLVAVDSTHFMLQCGDWALQYAVQGQPIAGWLVFDGSVVCSLF